MISNPSLLRKLIPIYFQRLTTEWEFTLSIRPISVKQSAHGRLQAANHKQTIEYLQPFYESIKKDELAADVLLRITEICDFMLKKEYMQANDSYVQLSIGNAPWPLGVTAIHAHERSTDKKLYSSEIGHVLNDETQRKWIQSLKRLMSFCQSVRPNDDVSKNIG